MCVAIIKPIGVKMPSKEILDQCWRANSDGGGFMYLADGKLHIEKGFMRKKTMMKALNKHRFKKDDYVVIHMRISTGGGVTPGNTHPYPISTSIKDLQALRITCDAAMVHNGILGESEDDLSDTGVFVRDCLAEKGIYENLDKKGVENLISHAVEGSRILIVDTRQDFTLRLGSWAYDHDTGLYFSNTNWKSWYNRSYSRNSSAGIGEKKFNVWKYDEKTNEELDSEDYLYVNGGWYPTAGVIEVCPQCNGFLEYDHSSDSYLCGDCGAEYIEALDGKVVTIQDYVGGMHDEDSKLWSATYCPECNCFVERRMENTWLFCTTCGAELIVSDETGELLSVDDGKPFGEKEEKEATQHLALVQNQ